jgi:hypothetical protein
MLIQHVRVFWGSGGGGRVSPVPILILGDGPTRTAMLPGRRNIGRLSRKLELKCDWSKKFWLKIYENFPKKWCKILRFQCILPFLKEDVYVIKLLYLGFLYIFKKLLLKHQITSKNLYLSYFCIFFLNRRIFLAKQPDSLDGTWRHLRRDRYRTPVISGPSQDAVAASAGGEEDGPLAARLECGDGTMSGRAGRPITIPGGTSRSMIFWTNSGECGEKKIVQSLNF